MSAGERLSAVPVPVLPATSPGRLPLKDPALPRVTTIPSAARRMLDYSMSHRTQLYLDEAQYRWLKQRAGKSGSIAAVVRELIDAERARRLDRAADPLLSYLLEESPGTGRERTSVSTLDRDLYGG
jgi:hypothetical protein